MFDEPVRITLEGLPPSKVVTIFATTPASRECVYESFANYKSNSDGTIDLSKDESIFGTYFGVEPIGLFWSMIPYAKSKEKLARLLKFDVTTPQIYDLKVFDDEMQSLEECRNTRSKILTSVLLNRWFMSPGVRRIPVRENGIIATLFLPPGDGPFPGVINMFGGSPGLLEYKSSLLASHGLASLALAYFGMDHLPVDVHKKLNLEYFEKAVQFMKHHPAVQGDNGIGIYAICKGVEIALMMATYLEGIRCVVAINGSFLGGSGIVTYKDKEYGFEAIAYDKLVAGEDNDVAGMFEVSDYGKVEDFPSFIPFHKKHDISYMFIYGLADACMPSWILGGESERILKEENHPEFEILKYTDAGHLIEPPNIPYLGSFYQPGPKLNIFVSNGGKAEPHCKSQEDVWPKAKNFLKQKIAIKPDPAKSKL